jgi:hypothetical protein
MLKEFSSLNTITLGFRCNFFQNLSFFSGGYYCSSKRDVASVVHTSSMLPLLINLRLRQKKEQDIFKCLYRSKDIKFKKIKGQMKDMNYLCIHCSATYSFPISNCVFCWFQ